MAFREPPNPAQLEAIGKELSASITPTLARPSHLAFARNRVYPGRVLANSPAANLPERFRGSGPVDAVVFLDALSSQQSGRHSLPDVLVDMQLMSEGEARRVWADVLKCPPCTVPRLNVDRDAYLRAGPLFWWLHRMLPIQKKQIACGAMCHPQSVDWLEQRLGAGFKVVAELPRKVENASKQTGTEFDPEQLLLDSLADKGILKPEHLERIKASRDLIADPIQSWLRVRGLATDEQLNEVFLENFLLPPTESWEPEEVKRLSPLLSPGFAQTNHCYALEEKDAKVRVGLAQLPSEEAVREIHDRLAGCAVYFQALTWKQATQVQVALGTP